MAKASVAAPSDTARSIKESVSVNSMGALESDPIDYLLSSEVKRSFELANVVYSAGERKRSKGEERRGKGKSKFSIVVRKKTDADI